MAENRTPPSLEDLISRPEAMKLLGLRRSWFVRRDNKELTVYKEPNKRNATVFYDRREIMALLSPVAEDKPTPSELRA